MEELEWDNKRLKRSDKEKMEDYYHSDKSECCEFWDKKIIHDLGLDQISNNLVIVKRWPQLLISLYNITGVMSAIA